MSDHFTARRDWLHNFVPAEPSVRAFSNMNRDRDMVVLGVGVGTLLLRNAAGESLAIEEEVPLEGKFRTQIQDGLA